MHSKRVFAKRWLLLQIPFFLFVLLYALAYAYAKETGSDLFRCRISESLHIYCPGCGGSRAVFALCKGQVLQSVRYFLPVPLAALCLFISDVRMALFLLGKGSFPGRRFGYTCMILCISSVILQCILRNLLLFRGIDLLGDILPKM